MELLHREKHLKNNFSRKNKIAPENRIFSRKFYEKDYFFLLCFAISSLLFGLAYGGLQKELE
jgi:hypothetical protein